MIEDKQLVNSPMINYYLLIPVETEPVIPAQTEPLPTP